LRTNCFFFCSGDGCHELLSNIAGKSFFFGADVTNINEIKKAISLIVTENKKIIDEAIKTYFAQHNNVHHK